MKRGLPNVVADRFDPTKRYGLRVTLFAIAATLVLVPFSFLLVQVVSEGPVTRVDLNVAETIHEWIRDSGVLVAIAFVLSFLGIPAWFYVTVGASAFFFWRRGNWRVSLFLVVTNILGGAIDTAVKVAVDRPRPEFDDPITHAMGKSFPSGHSMASTVGYGTLLLAFMPFIPPRWRPRAIAAYVVLVALIGASRLGLGVHYLSDVLGGFVLGLAWLATSVAAFRIWRTEQRKPKAEVLEGAEPEVASTASG